MTGGWESDAQTAWRQQPELGSPSVVTEGDISTVTFYWRDPTGTELTSPIRRVWIYITGVTDHHQQRAPQSLQRISGTDIWQWQIRLNAGWRGSYCFIPSRNENDFSAAALQNPPDRMALREGWRKLLPQAIADPLNPLTSWRGGRGHPVSALHLPQAPAQPGWSDKAAFTAPRCLTWQSKRLGNQRRVWLFTTGESEPERRPLAILLDGQFWAEQMPIWSALQAETDRGHLPPAVYLLPDVIDTQHRSEELTCNAEFWLAVQEELMPMLSEQTLWRDDPATTVIAGQSFGGLSALYAALHWPQRFGCALSQSGSFWWPHRQRTGEEGRLAQQLKQGELDASPLSIYLEAGLREPVVLHANQHIYPLLQNAQSLHYRLFDGGHDALCWRGGLINGLVTLWQPVRALSGVIDGTE
ncbi:enterochelin esterase [Kalamiella sp. sgz302252]|uniref:enterochelin esterase n=1 Tax=Pantoea sp. sgz302252 TaxID=3341827 RepID=UPI0036D41332